ncbi:MAG: LysM peptidoglycan-binding domain-containing M23 family metallopeptidase [Hyphomicrobiales bacterium]|nr:LysM peptidoglycan-binding domain-containing M23 family metallopeptidase [Hyphomicrobiales bacterium]
MSGVSQMLRSRFSPRAAVLALVSVGVAACSADTTRFNDNPFASLSNPAPTAGMPQAQTAQAPQSHSGMSTSVAANSGAASEVTGSVLRKPTSSGNWSWDGGTAITVAAGETIDTIARRHGVPASVIMQANNITAPATLYPGERLVIPRYKSSRVATAPAPRPAVPTPAPAASPPGNGSVHVVAAGDTLSKIAHRYHKPVNEIAKANNIQPTATLNVGDRLTIPGAQPSPVKASASPPAAPAKPVASAAPKEAEPAQNANVVAPTDQLDKEAAKLAEGTGAVPKFRWPANGRVIAGYGPTTNGQQNDGINIALPENTPLKAAEDGVVAYAGNELKGYGNLVLVRHPNGYVTAYAHTKELLVKRGDQVKRGQVIARSGQTGNVNAPQLHFEIRKGASPLDPTRFLNGA